MINQQVTEIMNSDLPLYLKSRLIAELVKGDSPEVKVYNEYEHK